jgi:SAM-dependent methyltransferase
MDTVFGFIAARTLATGVELDVFTHIAQGARTPAGLAEKTGDSERGLRMLTDALAGMGFLQKTPEGLFLAPDAEKFLVRTSPAYLGAVVRHIEPLWDTWQHLTQAVRTGSGQAIGKKTSEEEFFASFVDGLFALGFPAAQAAARALGGQVREVLDLGAGSGVWSLAFAAAHPEVRVTLVDYPGVLPVTRTFARRLQVAERCTFLAGDFHQVDLEEGAYDLVTLGQILHGESYEESLRLLRRAQAALRPAGALLIAEMIPDEGRCRDTFALLFGMNMLMLTEKGDVYTASQLEDMVRQAGFGEVGWLEVPAPYPLLVARRGSGNAC